MIRARRLSRFADFSLAGQIRKCYKDRVDNRSFRAAVLCQKGDEQAEEARWGLLLTMGRQNMGI